MFAISFIGTSCLIHSTAFQQTSPTQFVFDISSSVGANANALKEVFLSLETPNSLPADAALSLYTSIGGSDFVFRGFVSNSHPSDVMPLSWGNEEGTSHPIILGVGIEPLEEASAKHGAKIGAKEDFCRRVGMDLFQYMQSYSGVSQVGPDQIVCPTNVLDKWFNRISNRLRNDPDFLTRKKDII
ncbi:hypothetical protein M9434_000269 [Picochlorum sp. BPE23]|jgi:hypothetical protein|nr:hypothetical protein M9434_000269 [Picochlorum sp. BPE23]KAI8106299.1 hypothetical protein M9435_000845 [Picochlorum sp. BPE23]